MILFHIFNYNAFFIVSLKKQYQFMTGIFTSLNNIIIYPAGVMQIMNHIHLFRLHFTNEIYYFFFLTTAKVALKGLYNTSVYLN